MKKHISVGLVLLSLVIMLIPVYGGQRYSDLPLHHWAYHYVEDLSLAGLISGYPDGTFGPDREITYGEFIKLITVSRTGEALEQPADCWALNYYNEAVRMGLFTLAEVGLNDLDSVIPRKDMALMAANLLRNSGYADTGSQGLPDKISDVSHYTGNAGEIALCYNAGVLNGYPDGTFRPHGSLSRAEAVTVIVRLSDLVPQAVAEKAEFSGVETVKNRDFKVTNYKVEPGFRGIENIRFNEYTGVISVYSKENQEVTLFLDGYMTEPVLDAEAEFTVDNGLYVYYFLPGGYYRSGVKKGIAFGEYIEEVYYFDGL